MNRKNFLLALAFVATYAFAQSALILDHATATGAGPSVSGNKVPGRNQTYQVYGSTTAGTGTAVVNVEGSNNGSSFDVIGTVSLSLTSATVAVSNSFTSADGYARLRGNVTTINGTGTWVSITAGY